MGSLITSTKTARAVGLPNPEEDGYTPLRFGGATVAWVSSEFKDDSLGPTLLLVRMGKDSYIPEAWKHDDPSFRESVLNLRKIGKRIIIDVPVGSLDVSSDKEILYTEKSVRTLRARAQTVLLLHHELVQQQINTLPTATEAITQIVNAKHWGDQLKWRGKVPPLIRAGKSSSVFDNPSYAFSLVDSIHLVELGSGRSIPVMEYLPTTVLKASDYPRTITVTVKDQQDFAEATKCVVDGLRVFSKTTGQKESYLQALVVWEDSNEAEWFRIGKVVPIAEFRMVVKEQ